MRALAGQPSSPYQLGQRNAGSSCKLEITSLDDDEVVFQPDAMRYRVDNLTAMVKLLDWTDVIDPESTQIIFIPSTINQITFSGNDFEIIQVTVEITREDEDGDEVEQQVFLYNLANIAQPIVFQTPPP